MRSLKVFSAFAVAASLVAAAPAFSKPTVHAQGTGGHAKQQSVHTAPKSMGGGTKQK